MANDLISGSKEIIMKLHYFTERGFQESDKDWADKLATVIDVLEILLEMFPSLINEELVKRLDIDNESEAEFMYFRMKFARLIHEINDVITLLTKASVGRRFSDQMESKYEQLISQNKDLFNALDVDKKKLEDIEELIRFNETQKEELIQLRRKIEQKLMEMNNQRIEIDDLFREVATLQKYSDKDTLPDQAELNA